MSRIRGNWKGVNRSPHRHDRIMASCDQAAAARRIRNTNIQRPFVDDDIRLMTPRKLGRDYGFKVSGRLAMWLILRRRLGREYIWKLHLSSPKGQKWIMQRLARILEGPARMFLRDEEIVSQLDMDVGVRGDVIALLYPFIPDPETEGFADIADGKTNKALVAGVDERPIIEIP